MSKTLGFIADSSARKREGCTGPRITNHKRHRRALTSHANSGRIHLNQPKVEAAGQQHVTVVEGNHMVETGRAGKF